jgi:hypothetical protein
MRWLAKPFMRVDSQKLVSDLAEAREKEEREEG